jgi:Icc-related predicted phosphoesterase
VSTFVYATDLHGNRESYERLFQLGADAVVLGGDLLPHTKGTLERRVEAQRAFARDYLADRFTSRPCYWIAGNDDWAVALEMLEGKGIPIHGRAVPFLDGRFIAGCAHVPVTPFGMKDHDRFDSEDWTPRSSAPRVLFSTPEGVVTSSLDAVRARGTIAGELERLAEASDPAKTIYVTHSPPWGTRLDRLSSGIPVGSRAIRSFIERHRPPLTLHGHVHESPGEDRIGPTVCVNPGDSLGGLRAVRVDLGDGSVSWLP